MLLGQGHPSVLRTPWAHQKVVPITFPVEQVPFAVVPHNFTLHFHGIFSCLWVPPRTAELNQLLRSRQFPLD